MNGNRITKGKLRLPDRVRPVPWSGELDGEKATPGRYVLRLRLYDRAGNRSDYSRPLPVTLRYLQFAKHTLNARPGEALPRPARHRLPQGGVAARGPERHRTRARAEAARPGRRGAYRLVVRANGNKDRATVLVGAVP